MRVDLAAAGLLPGLPAAFLAGRDRDLLAPLRFLPPRETPSGPPIPGARREVAEALAVTNGSYGHPKADELARKLADPATRVVVTGQQPGLLGGPLYSVAKAVAAARWAAELEARGEPAVAVFWVSTEDHDWAEVSSAVVPTAEGPRSFDLGPDPEPLMPVGMRTFGPGIAEVLRSLAEAVPGERYADWLAEAGRWYRPNARFGEAFCRLMAAVLGPHCPLLLDSLLPALKAAQRPWLRRIVERREAFDEAIATREAEIQARGHSLQVSSHPGLSPLFLLSRGERRRIEWRGGDAWSLRGREGDGGDVAELLRIVDENPEVVSPGVLARTAIQDAVLGSYLQVLGPGELSYMAQVSAIYPVLEVEAPWTSLRPQTLVLDANQIEKLEGLGISLADLIGDRQRLDRALAEDGDFVTSVRARVEEALATLRDPALATDPNLERPLEKTREQILRALDTFADKVVSASARRNEVRTRRVEQLREAVLPQGRLQERVVASAHFPGKYGSGFVESYWEQMELDPSFLQVVSV
ncbi:MAG TPA: bacillithiol biosynthesis cysteine-adding enzyme BshC [Thermoanaerobaculia bacterium]